MSSEMDDFFYELIRNAGWDTDGFGTESILICPHGHRVEQDGECPEGCRSPLLEMGLI